jgi:hypothetical protein
MTRNFNTGTGGFAAPTETTAVCILPAMELAFPRRGRAQGHKAKDIIGRVYGYFLFTLCAEWERLSNEALPFQAMVRLHPKEVPLCLTGTVSKICWCFCTGTLRRRLTRSHSIVGASSMAICQWD